MIISECEKDVLHFKGFLYEMEITNVLHYKTMEAAKAQLTGARKAKIDVVLVNMDCTYENREKVYGEIAVIHEWIQVPIILVTSYDTRETIGGAFFAGIFDFMLKPVDFSYFKARIHIAINYNSESRRRQVQDYNLEQDLMIAKNVQKSALTPSLQLDWLQVDGFNRMSHTLGGDMYCWTQVSERVVSTVLYDVMGHGVASALVSMSIRSILRELMAHSSDPIHVMQELNRHVYELFEMEQLDGFLVTAIYVVVDKDQGLVEYVNAAHPTAFLFSESVPHALVANTPILGLIPKINVQKQRLVVGERARIILYTDGLQRDNHSLQSDYFLPYVANDNEVDLRRFVEDHQLAVRPIKDDISLIFMTIHDEGKAHF